MPTMADSGADYDERSLFMTGKTDNLHPELMAVLVQIEEKLGRELYINSGHRDEAHNTAVGGVRGSEHTYFSAEGVDAACKNGRECWEIVNAAIAVGVVRIGIGKTFVHIGIAKDKPQNVIWHYYPIAEKAKV